MVQIVARPRPQPAQIARPFPAPAPARYERHARGFAASAGGTVGAADASRAPEQFARRALFIRSSVDRRVAIDGSLASNVAWPGARRRRVEGLGQRRILFDPAGVPATFELVPPNP